MSQGIQIDKLKKEFKRIFINCICLIFWLVFWYLNLECNKFLHQMVISRSFFGDYSSSWMWVVTIVSIVPSNLQKSTSVHSPSSYEKVFNPRYIYCNRVWLKLNISFFDIQTLQGNSKQYKPNSTFKFDKVNRVLLLVIMKFCVRILE